MDGQAPSPTCSTTTPDEGGREEGRGRDGCLVLSFLARSAVHQHASTLHHKEGE